MSNKIIDYLKAHPRSTSKQIQNGLGMPTKVTGYLSKLCNSGRINKELYSRTITNVPIYCYWVNEGEGSKRMLPASKRKDVSSQSSIDSMIDGIAKSLASQIVSRINGHVAFEMSRMTTGIGINEIIAPVPVKREETALALPTPAEIAIRITEQPKEKKISKPCALVVGLLPVQAGIIQRDFGDAYTLKFWKDDGEDRLRALSKQADIVFLHINHMSHPTETAIRKHNKNCIRVGGGLSNIKVEMSNWYGQEWHK